MASLFPDKLLARSDILVHTLGVKKEKNAAFKSALVHRPGFKCFEPGPAVKMNGGFFSQSQMMENPIVRNSTPAVSAV